MGGRKKQGVVSAATSIEVPSTHTTSISNSGAGPIARSSTTNRKYPSRLTAARNTRKSGKSRSAFEGKRRRTRKVDKASVSEEFAEQPIVDTEALQTPPKVAQPNNPSTTPSTNQPEADADETPPVLQRMLDQLERQYKSTMMYMQTPKYVEFVKQQIKMGQERNQQLKRFIQILEKKNQHLCAEGVALVHTRMSEMGINLTTTENLSTDLTDAKNQLQTVGKLEEDILNNVVADVKAILLSEKQAKKTANEPPVILQPVQLTDMSVPKIGSRADTDKVPSQPSGTTTPIYAEQASESSVIDSTTPDTSPTVIDISTEKTCT